MSGTQSQFSWGGAMGKGAGTIFRLVRTRVLGKPGRNSRIFRGVRSGMSGFAKPLMATLKVLFLQVSGLIFLFFSASVVVAFHHEYQKYASHQEGLHRVVLAGIIGTMFLYFGVSSFWRASRKQRSRI